VFGEIKSDDVRGMVDLSGREMWLLAPIAAVVLWMGVYPESFLAPMRKDVAVLLDRVDRAKPASDSNPTAGKPATVHSAAHGEAH
jgi:NADH-quinone oxidoreductase subunit M